jgi:hypothetical protein
MSKLKSSLLSITLVGTCAAILAGCSPKVGSEAWCEQLKEKPKGDWTMNEGSDYTKHCIFK